MDVKEQNAKPENQPMFPPNGGLIRSAAVAIKEVGISGVIAFLLVWVGSQEIPKLVRQSELTYQETLKNREIMREHMAQTDELLRLSRWICAGVSKNESDRENCFRK